MIFDDWKSLLHFGYGFVSSAVLLHSRISFLLLLLLFLSYEVYESITISEFIYDCLEFVFGAIAGLITTYLTPRIRTLLKR
jgi:hypothetical protein